MLYNEQDHEHQPIFFLDLAEVERKYCLIQHLLPNCKIHYAVKCCFDEGVIKRLNEIGSQFDVATLGEVNLLSDLGVSMSKCIHTHPIKTQKEIKQAMAAGITTFVIENEAELQKFESIKSDVKLLLRLGFSNEDAAFDLSNKYGLLPDNAVQFIITAQAAGYKIEGLCFHVGSQMRSNQMYLKALSICKDIFTELAQVGIDLTTLDIGGGFPYFKDETETSLHDFFDPINTYLKEHFSSVNCLAEPGRFIMASAGHLFLQVIGVAMRNEKYYYHLNDGVYGCISSIFFDIFNISNQLRCINKEGEELFPSTLLGPTCDSVDTIAKDVLLPLLSIGDIIRISDCGAYCLATKTNFNLVEPVKIIYIQ
jgi:ornithine decarboxylase